MSSSPYITALEAAGMKVLADREFGDYQGDWIALVEYNGEIGYIQDCYGSCSGCDSYESDVGYDATPEQIREFGLRYTDQIVSYDLLMKKYQEQGKWDREANDVVKFLEETKSFRFNNDVQKVLKEDK